MLEHSKASTYPSIRSFKVNVLRSRRVNGAPDHRSKISVLAADAYRYHGSSSSSSLPSSVSSSYGDGDGGGGGWGHGKDYRGRYATLLQSYYYYHACIHVPYHQSSPPCIPNYNTITSLTGDGDGRDDGGSNKHVYFTSFALIFGFQQLDSTESKPVQVFLSDWLHKTGYMEAGC